LLVGIGPVDVYEVNRRRWNAHANLEWPRQREHGSQFWLPESTSLRTQDNGTIRVNSWRAPPYRAGGRRVARQPAFGLRWRTYSCRRRAKRGW